MKFIERSIYKRFVQRLVPNKVLLLLGPRRVGKTVFLDQVMKGLKEPCLKLNGENIQTLKLLEERSVQNYKSMLGDNRILVIDEAQKIPDIGMVLKLMVDEIKGIRIIATGSSAFDLTNRMGEPLTGRKIHFQLHPLAQMEFGQVEDHLQTKNNLEERLIFGSYPELLHIGSRARKREYLEEVVGSYLLKDILALDGMRNTAKMFDLLRLIAYQVGKNVSNHELGVQLGMSKNTVDRYLDLLANVFVIYKMQGYSRNLRKEISKTGRWYFYDNGIRNALIANFNMLKVRNDVGELWENYAMAERIKFRDYTSLYANKFFWRTYDQQEIDCVEERGGKLYGFEMKWNPKKKISAPSAWKAAYPGSTFQVIHPGNYLKWIGC